MAENATKCSAADGVTQTFDFCHGTPLMVRAVDFNALHAECQKLRKDAERYRWLRDKAPGEIVFDHTESQRDGGSHFMLIVPFDGEPVHNDAHSAVKLDAAIDAAMAEAPAVGAA